MRVAGLHAGIVLMAMLCSGANGQGQSGATVKHQASAIQVAMVQSDEVKLPAEFQISLYENLIQQLEKKKTFAKVYREGDHNAAKAADLVVLTSTVRGFKEGSERLRQVTTVKGATTISVHCVFTDKDGKVLLERDINGKVRFFGANLRATLDFAKKAAQAAGDNFTGQAGA